MACTLVFDALGRALEVRGFSRLWW